MPDYCFTIIGAIIGVIVTKIMQYIRTGTGRLTVEITDEGDLILKRLELLDEVDYLKKAKRIILTIIKQ